MSIDDYRAMRRLDSEYREVERRLKLRLGIADWFFRLYMGCLGRLGMLEDGGE